MIDDKELLAKTQQYVEKLLGESLPEGFYYHNLDHTQKVVAATIEIGTKSNLSEYDVNTLQLAAWFHDLGYITTYSGHEDAGIEMSREYFSKSGMDEIRLQQIIRLIEVTKLHVTPETLMEKVMKDADLYNLTSPEAINNALNIRKEWEIFRNEFFSDKKWDKMNLYFLEEHEYYTEYGKQVLELEKQKNIKKLKKKMDKKGDNQFDLEAADSRDELKKIRKKIDKLKDERPDRGIETMFRTTYRVHVNLSSIADNKANILLSINALIISVVITKLIDSSSDPRLIIPGAILMIVCLATIVFAILSTRPNITKGRFTREDIHEKKANLMFFGNFHNMDMEEYIWGINEMMKDSDYLYGSMSKDIYYLGKVLAKKFEQLRLAYNIFMYGMIVVVIVFIITFFALAPVK